MSEKTAFENLKVYKLAEQLAELSWAVIQNWRYLEKDTIGKQLIRSSDSVGANIAEGTGRGSKKDNMRFAKIARGSLFEVKHWFRRAYKQNLLAGPEIAKFKEIYDILAPKLSAYIKSMKE